MSDPDEIKNRMYSVNRDIWTPGRFSEGLYEFTLNENGLKVLLFPIQSGKKVVCVNVTYNVGSAMEKQGETGYCHLLEHANFKHANVWKHQAVGATINATTRCDITNYYATLPISDMRSYLNCEANRMIEPHFTQADLDKELFVVHNEYERGENSCFQALYKSTIAASMTSHPYHHSTIGYDLDIRRVTDKSLKSFFHRYYVPNNAALTITGDFSLGDALDNIHAEFSRVSRSVEEVPLRDFFEIKQEGMRQVMMHRVDKASLVQMAFHAPAAHKSDSLALEVISKIIRNGDIGRGRKLSEKGPFFDISMMTRRMRDTYPVMLVAQMNTAEQETGMHMMYGLLNEMKIEKVPTDELEIAKTAVLRDYELDGLGSEGMMNAINDALQRRWDAFDMFDRVRVVKSLTQEDVMRACNNTFNEDSLTIGRYLPSDGNITALVESPIVSSHSSYDLSPCFLPSAADHSAISYTKLTKTWSLGDGAICLNQVPSCRDLKTRFIISALLPSSHNIGAVASVASNMFLEGVVLNGSSITGDQLKIFMNKRGISLSVDRTLGQINFRTTCKAGDTDVAMKLVASIIKKPTFPTVRLPIVRARVIAESQGRISDVSMSAGAHLMQSMYPTEHPRYVLPHQEHADAVKNVSYADLLHFHKQMLGAHFLVTAMSNGDVVEGCKHIVPNTLLHMPSMHLSTMPQASSQTLFIPGKTSAALQMGIPLNLSRRDKDFIPLRLAAMALGNGFTGRLMQKVRDEAGLTYGIYADVLGGRPGVAYSSVFKIQSSFNPSVFYKGKAMTMEILNEWIAGGITAEELEKQRGFWVGHRAVQLDNPNYEMQILHINTCDRVDIADMDLFEERINKVTLQEVNEAMRKYINLEKLHVVEVGTLQ